MELLGKLGIDLKLLLSQIVNFGILLWLLNRFVYKPIIKRIEKDEAALNKAQTEAIELEKVKQEFSATKKQELTAAKKQTREIIKEAEKVAEELKDRALKEAETEKKAVIKQIKGRLKEVEDEKKSS